MKTAITLLFFLALSLSFPNQIFGEETPPISGAPAPEEGPTWHLKSTSEYFIKAQIDLDNQNIDTDRLIRTIKKLEELPTKNIVPQQEEIRYMRAFCGRLKRHHLIGPGAHNDNPQAYTYFTEKCRHPVIDPPGLCAQVELTNASHSTIEKTLPAVSQELRDFCYRPGEQKNPDIADGNQVAASNNDNRFFAKQNLHNNNPNISDSGRVLTQ